MGFLTDMPDGVPGLHRPDPEVGGDAAAAAARRRATTRWRSASGTSCPAGERSHAGPFDRWPLGFGFERYYGFLQGDTNHWSAEPRPRQPLRRPAGDARRRLPPHRGPRRHRDPRTCTTSTTRHPTARSSSTSRSARCTRRITSRRSGSSRTAVAFDDGWERWRERGVRAPGRARHRARRAPSSAERPSWVAGRGTRCRDDERRAVRAPAGGVRRLPHRTPTRRSGASLDHLERHRRARRHARDARLRQRHQRRRRRARHVQRAPLHAALPDTVEDNLARVDELGGVPLLQPLPVGLGVGGQHAAAAVEALHVAGRHAHAADRALAARHRGARRGARPVRARDRPHAHGARRRAASTRPPTVDGVTQQPIDGVEPRATFDDARRADPRDGAVLRDARLALDRRRRLEGDHRPRVARASSTRSGSSRAAATSPTTAGRCSAWPTTSPRRATSPPSTPTCCATLQDRWLAEAERNQVFPLVDELVGRIAAVMPPPESVPRRAWCTGPTGGPVPDDSVPRLFGGFRLDRRRRRARRAARQGILAAMGDWTSGFALLRARRPARVRAQPRRRRVPGRERRSPVPGGPPPVVVRVHARASTGRASASFHDDDARRVTRC